MNIFFLHFDPKTCAQMHVDKHVVKMILESVQLLCSAHHLYPNGKELKLMKLTHKNHPSSIWTRESLSNYKWLVELTKELCKEYTYRYEKVHKCEREYLQILEENNPDIADIGFTPPKQAMLETYKIESDKIEDAIEAYRQYYFYEKNSMFKWKKRNVPDWIVEYEKMFE
jgi:hypothetical protein